MAKCNVSEIQVGDKILYAPHIIHALKPDNKGEYPWVVGKMKHKVQNGEMGLVLEKELTDDELSVWLDFIGRCPSPREESQKLKLLRPKKSWQAVVAAVNKDGTVNLDIQSSQGGVTLHYDNLAFDDEVVRNTREPHTCHISTDLHKQIANRRGASTPEVKK